MAMATPHARRPEVSARVSLIWSTHDCVLSQACEAAAMGAPQQTGIGEGMPAAQGSMFDSTDTDDLAIDMTLDNLSASSSWAQRYRARHQSVREALLPYQQAFGAGHAGSAAARKQLSSLFKLWDEPAPLRIDIQTWTSLLDTLHEQCAGFEDLLRYVALPHCPAGCMAALHYLRQRLALIKRPGELIEQRSFRDLQARVPTSFKCSNTVRKQCCAAKSGTAAVFRGVNVCCSYVMTAVQYGSCYSWLCWAHVNSHKCILLCRETWSAARHKP